MWVHFAIAKGIACRAYLSVEKLTCRDQVRRVQPLGEPLVDWPEQLCRVLASALCLPKASQAGRRSELERLRGARLGISERCEEVPLGIAGSPRRSNRYLSPQ